MASCRPWRNGGLFDCRNCFFASKGKFFKSMCQLPVNWGVLKRLCIYCTCHNLYQNFAYIVSISDDTQNLMRTWLDMFFLSVCESHQWPSSYFGDQWMGYYKITMSWDSLQRQSSIWHEPFCRFKGQCDARAKFVQVQPYLQKGCPPIILHMDNIGFNYRCVSLMHSSYDVI